MTISTALEIAAASILLSGCTLPPIMVPLTYVSPSNVLVTQASSSSIALVIEDKREPFCFFREPISGQLKRATTLGEISQSICGPVGDMVGTASTDGYLGATMKAEIQPATLVRRAFEKELSARGYSMVDTGTMLVVSITSFWAETVGGLNRDTIGEVKFKVLVRTKMGEVLYQRDIAGRGNEPIGALDLFSDSPLMKIPLELALTDAMKVLLTDQKFLLALSKE